MANNIICQPSKYSFISGDSVFILDLFRVIACQLVILCRPFEIYLNYNRIPADASDLGSKIAVYLYEFLGSTGVILFFFMSGIVISNSLFKKMNKGNYNFQNFFIDRFSRIYSGLVPCMIVIVVVGYLIKLIDPTFYTDMSTALRTSSSLEVVIANLLMLQYFPALQFKTPDFAGTLWTLNMEWWIYLMFGWLAIKHASLLKLDIKSILLLSVFAFFPLYKFITGDYNLVAVWFAGVLITLVVMNGGIIKNIILRISKSYLLIFALLGLVLLRVGINFVTGNWTYDPVIELLLGLLMILLVVKNNGVALFKSSTIKNIVNLMARYSFTLYLVHVGIGYLIFEMNIVYGLNLHPVAVSAIYIICANVLALAIAYPTEMQYKKLTKILNDMVIKRSLNGGVKAASPVNKV
jgi:peptidoglycan/LPS O-acetylase OafA/YrhL